MFDTTRLKLVTITILLDPYALENSHEARAHRHIAGAHRHEARAHSYEYFIVTSILGKYENIGGSTFFGCAPCNSGKWSTGGVCIGCVAGFYSDGCSSQGVLHDCLLLLFYCVLLLHDCVIFLHNCVLLQMTVVWCSVEGVTRIQYGLVPDLIPAEFLKMSQKYCKLTVVTISSLL